MEQQLILDRYRPLSELAEGGFGDVVLAYDTRMQRRVAIKRMPLPRAVRGSRAGLAEARTAALLNHPAIVTVHEWDTDSDEAFIIMEYVEGVSLADLLDEYGSLDFDEAAAVFDAVSSAVEHAHENGVLHLDIKPDNVLVTRDGLVKVTDFGVAALSTATGHGPTVGGTLGHMPVEQLRDEAVDERTDVWALAALTFEMLTDANPFSAASVGGALFRARVADLPAPSDFEPDIPAEVDDVLLAALAEHADERYASVDEFADRLEPYLGDPALGRETLADSVSEMLGMAEEPVESWDRIGVWDRLTPFGGLAVRAGSALVAAWLTWAGLGTLGLAPLPLSGASALAALAALLAPALGVAIGLGALVVGLFAADFWAVAIGFAAASGLIWWFAGRGDAGMTGALLAPVAGIAKCAPAIPPLLGFVYPPVRAALLAGYASLATMLVAAASGAQAPYLDVSWRYFLDPLGTRVVAGNVRLLFSTPAPLVVALAWMVAAAVMSLFCSRATTPLAVAGGAAAIATMYGGYALANTVASLGDASATWSGAALLPHLAASSILLVLVVAAGPPPRPEEE